jgi:hypothetical protein
MKWTWKFLALRWPLSFCFSQQKRIIIILLYYSSNGNKPDSDGWKRHFLPEPKEVSTILYVVIDIIYISGYKTTRRPGQSNLSIGQKSPTFILKRIASLNRHSVNWIMSHLGYSRITQREFQVIFLKKKMQRKTFERWSVMHFKRDEQVGHDRMARWRKGKFPGESIKPVWTGRCHLRVGYRWNFTILGERIEVDWLHGDDKGNQLGRANRLTSE